MSSLVIKMSFLENVAKGIESKSKNPEALGAVPHWSRSSANIHQKIDYTNNVRFGRHNNLANEDYYRTRNEFQTAKINYKPEHEEDISDKENIVELPDAMLQAFYQKLLEDDKNQDLALSPQSEKHSKTARKGRQRARSTNNDEDVIDRLYKSPSPFYSPDALKSWYLTEKGKRRLHSAISVKIPKKTLYVIDKVVRKKLRKESLKLRQSFQRSGYPKGYKGTLSPRMGSSKENLLRETRERLDFKTPEKQSNERQTENLNTIQR